MNNEITPPPAPWRIFAIDVGSTLSSPKTFAWAVKEPEAAAISGSQCIECLVECIAADLRRGDSVALGFEAPLFLPIPSDAKKLSRGREDLDGNRSCFAPAGGYVAMLGLHQAAFILARLHSLCGRDCDLSVNSDQWPPQSTGRPVLFCWEAFVSGKAHAGKDQREPHLGDAATAASCFADRVKKKSLSSEAAGGCLSLIGAAALWSGWRKDINVLMTPPVVVKACEAETKEVSLRIPCLGHSPKTAE